MEEKIVSYKELIEQIKPQVTKLLHDDERLQFMVIEKTATANTTVYENTKTEVDHERVIGFTVYNSESYITMLLKINNQDIFQDPFPINICNATYGVFNRYIRLNSSAKGSPINIELKNNHSSTSKALVLIFFTTKKK